MEIKEKKLIVGCVIFVISLIIFSLYHNACWYPEKNRCLYEIEIKYQSGRNIIQEYDLPKGTKFWISTRNHKHGESNTYLKYHFNKPFGNEHGYIAFDVDDYEILSVKDIK